MVQFMSINFFLGFLQFLLGFSKFPVFLCHSVQESFNCPKKKKKWPEPTEACNSPRLHFSTNLTHGAFCKSSTFLSCIKSVATPSAVSV